jgi:hypothetical protein
MTGFHYKENEGHNRGLETLRANVTMDMLYTSMKIVLLHLTALDLVKLHSMSNWTGTTTTLPLTFCESPCVVLYQRVSYFGLGDISMCCEN